MSGGGSRAVALSAMLAAVVSVTVPGTAVAGLRLPVARPATLDSPLKVRLHPDRSRLAKPQASSPRSAPSNPATSTATCDGTWQRVDAVNGAGDDYLNSLSGTSGTDMWAVGTTTAVPQQGPDFTLAEHWDGRGWTTVATVNATMSDDNILAGASAAGRNDVWAVGAYVRARDGSGNRIFASLAEHYDGSAWGMAAVPNLGAGTNVLNAVAALSATNAWAVGAQVPAGQQRLTTLIEHWNGAGWSVIGSPNTGSGSNVLNDIVAIDANNIWAVGYYRPSNTSGSYRATLTLHWNGSSWSRVGSPNAVSGLDNTLYGVSGSGPNDLWAAGAYTRPPDNDPNTSDYVDQTLTMHWNGSGWAIVPSPNPGNYHTGTPYNPNNGGHQDLFAVVSRAPNDAWAVGTFAYVAPEPGLTPIYHTMAVHWDGARWNDNSYDTWGNTYAELDDVAGFGGVWAVGSLNGNDVQPLVATACSPPVVNALNPTSGPTRGGRPVSIEGSGLSMATQVMFGAVPAQGFSVLSDSRITAITPVEPAGTVDVTVQYFAGTSAPTVGDRYTFMLPSPPGPWWSRLWR
jgi:IPT/TIG domain